MGATTVGRLNVLLAMESAQFVSDVGKAKSAARDLGGGFGVTSAAAAAMSRKIEGLGGALGGAQQATAAASQAMKLMGAEGSAAASGLSNALSGLLAGGFTPLGLGIAAVTAALALFVGNKDLVSEALKSAEERSKKLTESLKALRLELNLLKSGKDASPAAIDIAAAEADLDKLRRMQAELRKFGPDWGDALRILGHTVFPKHGLFGAVGVASPLEHMGEAVKAQEKVVQLLRETKSTQDDVAAIRKRTESSAAREATSQKAVADAAKAAADALAKFDAAETTRRRALRDKGVEIESLLRPDLYPDAGIERQKSKVQDAIAELQKSNPAGRAEAEERVRFEREMLTLLERELEVRKKIAADAAKTATDQAAADAKRRADEERQNEAADAARRIVSDRESLGFELAQLDRDQTEREAAEVERRYAADIALAKKHGIDVVALEDLVAEKVRRIRASAATPVESPSSPAAAKDASLGGGFSQRMQEVQEMSAGWDRLGAQVADITLNEFGGLAHVLTEIATNQKTAEEAGKEWLRSFMFELAEAVERALILKAVLALFGAVAGDAGTLGTNSGTISYTNFGKTAGAHGGSWRVAGYGGLDSKLVAMKVSPGELVKVSDGANSQGEGGGVSVALTVRPPAVIADEVMAKSSSQARAAVVSSALSRGGRRGARARD